MVCGLQILFYIFLKRLAVNFSMDKFETYDYIITFFVMLSKKEFGTKKCNIYI